MRRRASHGTSGSGDTSDSNGSQETDSDAPSSDADAGLTSPDDSRATDSGAAPADTGAPSDTDSDSGSDSTDAPSPDSDSGLSSPDDSRATDTGAAPADTGAPSSDADAGPVSPDDSRTTDTGAGPYDRGTSTGSNDRTTELPNGTSTTDESRTDGFDREETEIAGPYKEAPEGVDPETASDLAEEVAGQSDLFNQTHVRVERSGNEVQAYIPRETKEEVLRESAASQTDLFEPGDFTVQETDEGLQATVPESEVRDTIKEQAAAGTDLFGPDDFTVQETDEGLQATVPEGEVRATVKEQAAESSDAFGPGDFTVQETEEGFQATPTDEAITDLRLERAAEGTEYDADDLTISGTAFDSSPPGGEAAPSGYSEIEVSEEAAKEQVKEDLAAEMSDQSAEDLTVERTDSGSYAITEVDNQRLSEPIEVGSQDVDSEDIAGGEVQTNDFGQTTAENFDPSDHGGDVSVTDLAHEATVGYVSAGVSSLGEEGREAIDEDTAERVAGTETVWSDDAITRLQDAGEWVGDEIREGAATGADYATGDFVTGGEGETEGYAEQAIVGAFGEAPAAVAEAPGEGAKIGQRATQATTVALRDPSAAPSIYRTTAGYGGVTVEQTAEEFEQQPVRTTATFGALAGGGVMATRGTRAAAAQRYDVSAPPTRQLPDVSERVGTRAREAGRSVAQRTPDVEVRRDPGAPKVELTPETRQAIRQAATAPARATRRAGQRVREVPGRARSGIGDAKTSARLQAEVLRADASERVSGAAEAVRTAPGRVTDRAALARARAGQRVGDAHTDLRYEATRLRGEVADRAASAVESVQAVPGRVTDRAALARARAGQRVGDVTTDVRYGAARARGEAAARATSAVESVRAAPGRIREATPRPDLELANRIGRTRERAESAFASATDLPADSPLQGEIRPQTFNARYFESDRPRFDPDGVLGNDRGGSVNPASAASTAGQVASSAAGRARSAVPSMGDVPRPRPRAYASAVSELSVRIGSRPERIPGDLDAPDDGRIIEIAADGGDARVDITPRDQAARRFRDVDSRSGDARQVAVQRAETQQRSGVGNDAVNVNRFGAMLDDAAAPAAMAAAGPTVDAGTSLDEETDPTALDDVGAGQVEATDQAPTSIENELPDVLGATDAVTPTDTVGESQAATTATRMDEAGTPMLRTETRMRPPQRPGRPPFVPPPQFPGASDDEPEGGGGIESAEELSGFYSPLSGELLEPEARTSGPLA